MSACSAKTCNTYPGSNSKMADGFSIIVSNVTAFLSREECRTLQYLCTGFFTNNCVEDLRGALMDFAEQNQDQTGQSWSGDVLLMELMFRLKRFDILKKVLGTNKQQVEGLLQKGGVLSDYRVLMADVSENLEKEDLQSIIFLLNSTLPKERTRTATSFLDVVVELEKLDEVSCDNLDLVEQCLRNIRRMDLVKRIQAYQNKGQNVSCAATKVLKQNSNYVPVHHQGPFNTVRQFKDLKLSVPETGTQHNQAAVEEYQINPAQKGLCVLIDCVGFDGEMLKQTFKCLGFTVIFHSLLSLKETQKVLEDLAHHRHLQRVTSFVCCLISRGTDTHLLACDSHGLGIRLEDLKQLFQCPSLSGKPKLFFTQIYQTTAAQQRPLMYDECLETDGPSCFHTGCPGILPVSEDVLWSVSITEAKLLERSGHHSVYLQTLSSALQGGCDRRMHLLDIMKEVDNGVSSHNQQNPGKIFQLQLLHKLRKKLYI